MRRLSRAAEEVADRAAEMGIDPEHLLDFEAARRRPLRRRMAMFFRTYKPVLGAEGVQPLAFGQGCTMRALVILYTARKCGVDGPMDPQRPQRLPPGPARSGATRRHAPCFRLRA